MRLKQEKFAEYLRLRGLNRTKFAKEIGYSHSAISLIERGKRRASAKFMSAVAKYTGLPLDYFFAPDVTNENKD
jgi:transcriptional regulator with XRE-family HTH domain